MGIIAHILENLPWKESEGIPAEAPKSLRLSGPGPGGHEATGQFGEVWQGQHLGDRGCRCSERPRFHCLKQTSPRRSVMFLTAPQPPADPGLFFSPSTGFLIRHKHSWSQSHSLSRRTSSGAVSRRGGRRTGREPLGLKHEAGLPLVGGRANLYLWPEMGPVDLKRLRQRDSMSLEALMVIPETEVLVLGLPVTSSVTFGPQFPHL